MTPCSSPVELSNAFVFTAFVLVEVGINLFDDCIEILVLPQRATGGYFAAARGTLLLAAAEAALDTAAAKTVHAFQRTGLTKLAFSFGICSASTNF